MTLTKALIIFTLLRKSNKLSTKVSHIIHEFVRYSEVRQDFEC
jgi:hypothetical protein